MQEVCICIPVRYGSTRLPGKPLLKLGKLTVIERTITQALKSKYIVADQIYVFTDDQRIADQVDHLGVHVIITREECPNAVYRISRYSKYLPERYKYIVNLHGDEPMLDPRNLDFLLKSYLSSKTSSILVKLLEDIESKSEIKVVKDKDDFMMYCSRSVIPSPTKKSARHYFGIIGIHIVDRITLAAYDSTPMPEDGWLYQTEDIEELKYLEIGGRLRCVLAPYRAERSLNTVEDYEYFVKNFSTS